jgi:large subunit ribosomal protein L28
MKSLMMNRVAAVVSGGGGPSRTFFSQSMMMPITTVVTGSNGIGTSIATNSSSSSGGGCSCGTSHEQRRFRSNRSKRGLYDGKDIRAGNNVSFSMKATKRTFKPNVFLKRVYSEVLDSMVPFHLTTSALRSIDKAGGLDSYLLTSRHITSGEGLEIRKRIIKKLKYESKQQPQVTSASSPTTTTTSTSS